MTRLLITGIGGDIAQSVARVIRERHPAIELVGADTHGQHGGSLFVDDLHLLPLAHAADYFDRLAALLENERIDVVIPMTEPELSVLAPFIAKRQDLQWVTAGAKVIEIGVDKLKTIESIKSLGLPVPWTVMANEGPPPAFPCILKSRFGSGSRAVFIVKDQAEADYLSSRHPDAVYQELLEPADQEVTCAVYRTRDGRVATLQMLRKLVGGFTGWAKVIDDKATSEMCAAIANGLGLHGSMNVQLRLTPEGPRVFEINPRFSSTVLMRDCVGFSDVSWVIDELEDRPVVFPDIKSGSIMVRTQGAAVLTTLPE